METTIYDEFELLEICEYKVGYNKIFVLINLKSYPYLKNGFVINLKNIKLDGFKNSIKEVEQGLITEINQLLA